MVAEAIKNVFTQNKNSIDLMLEKLEAQRKEEQAQRKEEQEKLETRLEKRLDKHEAVLTHFNLLAFSSVAGLLMTVIGLGIKTIFF
jgi:hypothetical protein